MACCQKTSQKCCLLGVGIVLVIISVILGLLWPGLSLKLIYQQLILQKGTQNYNNWVKTPFPVYFEIYMFNWTNPHEIEKFPNVKPHFEEVGPYVFQEIRERVDIDFDENVNTVNFNQTRIWHFKPELSGNLTLDDKITNLNVICATIAYNIRYMPGWERELIYKAYLDLACSLTKTAKVRELLYDGYSDKILQVLQVAKKAFPSMNINIPFSKFGWFYQRNGSAEHDGRVNMQTGKNNIYELGLMNAWNAVNQTNYFKRKCGQVMGTTGELWPPIKGNPSDTNLTMFIVDICRYLILKPDKNVTKYSMKGVQWSGDETMLDDGGTNSSCWCLADKCPDLKPGIFNASTCQFGAPAFMSYPHFYLADNFYRENIEGMKPNRSLHQFYVALEPFTGIPMEIRARLQINILLNPEPHSKIYKNAPSLLFPMLWFSQVVNISPELAEKASVIKELKDAGLWTSYVLAAFGALFVLIAMLLAFKNVDDSTDEDEAPILDNENNSPRPEVTSNHTQDNSTE